MIFLSHGDDDNINVTDGEYPRRKIMEKFRGNNVSSLVGKPKVFIFQTCNGSKPEIAVDLKKQETIIEDSDADPSNSEGVDSDRFCLAEGVNMPTLPAGAEFLVCNAANKGFFSYRNVKEGTRFIQTLVKVMTDYYNDKLQNKPDIVRLFTLVSCRVAAMDGPDPASKVKQMPAFTSTFTKLFYLPSCENPHEKKNPMIEPKSAVYAEQNI
uniref:Caspase-6 n=1 Tax=Phallusia mammillata TaxID=59560 RepID=A0A6F9D7M1_9ASCI|nr:caspase-6 [Phallusia mammillata]